MIPCILACRLPSFYEKVSMCWEDYEISIIQLSVSAVWTWLYRLGLPSVISAKSISAKKSQRETARYFISVRAVVSTLGVVIFLEFWITEWLAHALEQLLWPACLGLFVLCYLDFSFLLFRSYQNFLDI